MFIHGNRCVKHRIINCKLIIYTNVNEIEGVNEEEM